MPQVKILIIDDEINIGKTIAATFSDSDYVSELCQDGRTAWEKLRNEPWDIVFLDIRLPGLDGMEIIKRIHDNNLKVNVVMITAYGSIENAVQAMKYGAVDFIQKPLEPEKLRQVVRNVLVRPKLLERDLTEYNEFLEAAKLHIKNRNYPAAHNTLIKALEQKPESAEVYNLIGAVHEVMGDLLSAAQAYQMAIRFDKNYQPALDNLKRITSTEGNTASLTDMMAALKKILQ